MRALLVEADPGGDAQLVERLNQLYVTGRTADADVAGDLERRRTIAEGIRRVRAERPEIYQSALIQLRRYDERLRRFGLTDVALDWDRSRTAAIRFIAREAPLAIVLVPIAALGIIVFAAPYALTALASKVTSGTDVTATAKVVAGATIYTTWCALITAFGWWSAGVPFAVAVALALPILAVAGLVAIEREVSVWQTSLSWLASRGTRQTTIAALRRRRAELADVLDELHVDLFQSSA
jgi:hypothetical protein